MHSRGERSPWLPLETRPDSPGEPGMQPRAGKAGNPFQTTQGNRYSCRDQEGRRGSDEVVSGPSVFPSREPGVSGNFWGSQERCQVLFRTSRRKLGLPLEAPRLRQPQTPVADTLVSGCPHLEDVQVKSLHSPAASPGMWPFSGELEAAPASANKHNCLVA